MGADLRSSTPIGRFVRMMLLWGEDLDTSMPEDTTGGVAAGFNLDGLDSGDGSSASDANCEELTQDFDSATDPGHTGVDNAAQGLVSTIESLLDPAECPGTTQNGRVDATSAREIELGTTLILAVSEHPRRARHRLRRRRRQRLQQRVVRDLVPVAHGHE